MPAANTWRALALNSTHVTNGYMLDVFNASTSTRVIRIYRAWHWKISTDITPTTADTEYMTISRSTAASGGSSVTPVPHDGTNAALNAGTTVGTARTITSSDIFRRYIFATGTGTAPEQNFGLDGFYYVIPLSLVWEAGTLSSDVQSFKLRPSVGEGFAMRFTGTASSPTPGTSSLCIEFTDAAS